MSKKSRPRDPPSDEDWMPVLPAESSAPTEITQRAVSQVVDSGSADWPIEPVAPPAVPRIEPGALFDLEETLPAGSIPPLLDDASDSSADGTDAALLPRSSSSDVPSPSDDGSEIENHSADLLPDSVVMAVSPLDETEIVEVTPTAVLIPDDPTTPGPFAAPGFIDTTAPPEGTDPFHKPASTPADVTLDTAPAALPLEPTPAVTPLDGPPAAIETKTIPIEDVEETLLVAVEQQDKVMQLRAQQDQLLRQTFSDNSSDLLVMITGLVDSAAYREEHGELAARHKLLGKYSLIFPVIHTHAGTIVKTVRDGIMTCFSSADAALAAADGMLCALAEHNRRCRHPDEEIHIRVGLGFGQAVAEGGDIHGDAVDVAMRVQAEAATDEVLVTAAASSRASAAAPLEPAGSVEGPGQAEALFRLSWRSDPPHEPESPGLIAKRYRLGPPLGHGPLGVVFSADDVRLRVPVAVKVLHEFVSQDRQLSEVLLERVQTMASLVHPAIARVIDCAAAWPERAFYITERIGGRDLGAWVVGTGCPPPWRAARLLARVGEVLQFGHRHGVVHGNLKPENILVRPDGSPSVCDFGLGLVRDPDLPNAPGPLFPPSYQAPEQIIGERVDQRADVYSLGAVMYYLLAGRPPFESAPTLRAQRAVASGMYRRLHRVRPDLPHYITEVVAKAMAHSPNDRFSTVSELAEALHAFANTETAGE